MFPDISIGKEYNGYPDASYPEGNCFFCGRWVKQTPYITANRKGAQGMTYAYSNVNKVFHYFMAHYYATRCINQLYNTYFRTKCIRCLKPLKNHAIENYFVCNHCFQNKPHTEPPNPKVYADIELQRYMTINAY